MITLIRNIVLALVVCGLQLCPQKSVAAEKIRDWQTGQIVESGSNQKSDSRVHTIASKDKNYIVRGSIGDGDQALAVGASVRFAVEGKTMFVSLEGKEYRLYLLGERMASPPPAVSAAKPVVETGVVQASPVQASPVQSNDTLDNDAVVKMLVGGLKEDTVVRVIEARPGRYILTPDALTGLKAAGVPQIVIAAMAAKMSARK
jgi:hypothetical protein